MYGAVPSRLHVHTGARYLDPGVWVHAMVVRVQKTCATLRVDYPYTTDLGQRPHV